MGFLFYLMVVLFIFICLILMGLVLIQKGRGGGLASAFGGGGGHTPFGTKTGDVLTWTTSVVFGIFIMLAISLNWLANARQKASVNGLQVPIPNSSPLVPISRTVPTTPTK